MYRISKLIQLDRKIYHSNDLAILWGITNKNTLYTTIKRYVQKGVLTPIYKGLYSTVPLSQLDPPKLVEPCILAGSKQGDLVLDPFAGSGTVGQVFAIGGASSGWS